MSDELTSDGATDKVSLDSKMHFRAGLLLVLVSTLLLTIVEFNARHVFANPGVVEPATDGFLEWLLYVLTHPGQVLQALSSGWCLSLVTLSGGAAVAILLLRGRPGAQRGILIGLLAGVALDLALLLQFNGYNAGNGGYDGAEQFVLFLLHVAFGVLTLLFVLGSKGLRLMRRDISP